MSYATNSELLAKLAIYFKIVVRFDSNLYEILVLLYEKSNHSLCFLYEMGGWGDCVIFQLTFLIYKSLPFIDALF